VFSGAGHAAHMHAFYWTVPSAVTRCHCMRMSADTGIWSWLLRCRPLRNVTGLCKMHHLPEDPPAGASLVVGQ